MKTAALTKIGLNKKAPGQGLFVNVFVLGIYLVEQLHEDRPGVNLPGLGVGVAFD